MVIDEHRTEDMHWRQEWHCEAPPEGVRFQVLQDHWNFLATPWVRCIHEIRLEQS